MKEYSYKDVQLLRQIYKTTLEQLYESPSQERTEKMLNILTVASTAMDVNNFAEQLNSSGQLLLTASLQIFRAKCGICKEFVGEKMINAIDLLLYQFTKNLKNYTRKVKDMKLEIDLLQFYREGFANEDLFLLYISYFKILLPRLLPRITNQSNVEKSWVDLISNMISSLKRTHNQMVVSKCISIAHIICTQNRIFCKEFVKNGILLFLLDFIEKCQLRTLAIRCIDLIALVTSDKQVGQLLIQQRPEQVFAQLLSRFANYNELTFKIKTVMDNIIKYSEPDAINAVLQRAKQQCKQFTQNKSGIDNLNLTLQYLKLYSLSHGFAKYLQKSQAHKWITPLLEMSEAERAHVSVLQIIGCILGNKQAFRNSDEIFNSVNKPLLVNLKYPKSSAYLHQNLKVLQTALRRDIIDKEFTKKHNLIELLEKLLKENYPQCHKTINELLTLVELKQGKIKYLPLDVSRKNKQLKELESVNTYLDAVLSMGLYNQVRRQQFDILSEFLNVQEGDYPNDNEEEVQALSQDIFNKLLRLMSHMFVSVKAIESLVSSKLVDNMIQTLQASPDLKQSLDLLQIILVSNPSLKFNNESCINVLLNIHKNNPLNDNVVNGCGEIMFFMDSQDFVKDNLKSFSRQDKNVAFLEKLALNMCTIPQQMGESEVKDMDGVTGHLSQLNFSQLTEELVRNYLIILIRIANMSEIHRQHLRKNQQLIAKVQACFQKPPFKPYVLEFFRILAKMKDNAVHRGIRVGIDKSHLNSINENLKRLQKKVLEQNNYSLPELKFLEQLCKYDSKHISEKMKIKNAQTVHLAGMLFGKVLEQNKVESKKAKPIIEQLNKQLNLKNNNIINILRFFYTLKDEDHYANLQKLLQMLRQLSNMTTEDYSLYPQRYTILRLCLDCISQNLNKTNEMRDIQATLNMLEKVLKMLEKPSDPSAICNKRFITGEEDVKEQVIESIYNCVDAIARIEPVCVKPSDPIIKYAEACCNPYVMYVAARMLQRVVQDEGCNESRRKLKDSCNKKYPTVKAMIDFQNIQEEQKTNKTLDEQSQPSATKTIEQLNKKQSAASGSSNKMERLIRPTKTMIETSLTRKESMADISKMSVEMATKKVEELVALKETTPPPDYFLSRVIDALREDTSEKVDQLLAKLYMKYSKLIDKLCQQDADAMNRVIIRLQDSKTSVQYIIKTLQQNVETVDVTEKIKLVGERALMYAIKIFTTEPAFAAKIIEYNLVSEKEFKILQQYKIPEQILAIMQKSLKDPNIDKYVTLLIGSTAKYKFIQQFYTKNQMHVSILKVLQNNRKDSKIIGNCFYALAGITFCVEQMTKIIAIPNNIRFIIELIMENQNSTIVVESGCCLLSNLFYHNEQANKIFLACDVVDHIMELYKLQLQVKEYKGTMFKQMLRVLGNCSLLIDNAKKIVAKDFVPLSISLIEILHYNQDLEVLRCVIEVFSNMCSHTDGDLKIYRATLFKQNTLDMLLLLLQTQLLNAQIIMACIDAIDGMCQDKQIERYAVDKRLIFFTLDILKSHEWNEKIVIKGVRLISNLTLDKDFINKILEANVPSVLANILSNRKLQKNKLSLYRMKIITRIYNAKPRTDLLIRSGYIDCVLESLTKQTELFLEHIEILIYYSKDLTEFLSKKTFQIIVQILEKSQTDDIVYSKCVVLLKLIDKNVDVEPVVGPLSRIYMSLRVPVQDVSFLDKVRMQELLNLLIGYCSRCPNLKTILREKKLVDALNMWRKKALDSEDFLNESISACTIVILNEYIPKVVSGITKQESEEFLIKGLHCKMYRRDSTFKKAQVSMTQQYELRGFKFPDGQVKDKYRMHILNIKDACFKYDVTSRLWQLSVFSNSGGLFEKKADPKLCCTIVGPVTKVGSVMLNLQFQTEGMKDFLEKHLFNLIRHLREK